MTKKTVLKCPLCGGLQMKVRTCKEVEIVCRDCGASLLMTKNEDGSCNISARPQDTYESVQ